MADFICCLGLILNLLSMAMKDVLHLRIIALCANAVYIAYGVILRAAPLIVGGAIAVGIHAYQIYKLKGKRENENKSSCEKRRRFKESF